MSTKFHQALQIQIGFEFKFTDKDTLNVTHLLKISSGCSLLLLSFLSIPWSQSSPESAYPGK
jgi:hypothetical protein